MKPALECADCSTRVFVRVLENTDVDEKLRMKALARAMQALATRMEEGVAPVQFANEMFSTIRNVTGVDDPFRNLKQMSNKAALSILPKTLGLMKKRKGISALRSACLISISGNVIDVSTGNHSFSLRSLWDEIRRTLERGLDVDDTHAFTTDVKRGVSVFMVGDNAGEIVLDIPLIRLLRNRGIRVNYIVRGGPIANDATLEDAYQVGLDKEVDYLGSTGQRAFGIRIRELRQDNRSAFNASDVILAKGQSNYESLNWTPTHKPVFFLFRVKCKPIADTLGLAVGSNVFLKKGTIRRS